MDPSALARLRLRHLRCFLAVIQHGHLSRAAAALGLSQPAVTKTVGELEAILAVRLFERGRHGAVPTAAAEAFRRHAHDSLAALARGVDSVAPAEHAERLRLGALPTVAASVLAVALASFRAAQPQVPVRVDTDANPALLAALRAQALDAVVGRLAEPGQMVGLTFEHLVAEPIVIAARPGHPVLDGGTRLGAFPLVLPLPGTSLRHAADSFLQARGVVPGLGVVETLSVSLGRNLARRSDALWFTALGVVEPDVAAGLLVRVPTPPVGAEEPLGLLLRTDLLPSAPLQALIGAIRAAAAARLTAAPKAPMVG